ncbi:MAG TPA: acyltransferase [Acidisarcina sp.]|nr:acyltransferase [Acidisarcina sp.]
MKTHIPQLDGVRGIAILLVLLCHMGAIVRDTSIAPYLEFGWVGVDLFFVLSGFLITRILVGTRDKSGYWWRFYSRRGLRIWPLYYAFLFVNAGLIVASSHVGFLERIIHSSANLRAHPLSIATPWVLYLVLAQNFYPATLFSFKDFTSITWSLCIEEHFYVVWPLLVRRLSIPRLRVILVLLLLLSPIARLVAFLSFHGGNYDVYYQMVNRVTPFHLDGLIAGCLLALSWNPLEPRRYARVFVALFLGGGIVSAVLLRFVNHGIAFSFVFSCLAALFAGLVGLALMGWQLRFFSNSILRYIGTISYGLYLIHPTVFLIFQSHSIYSKLGITNNLAVVELVAAAIAIACSFALATLSWRYFESPILRLKDRLTS